MPVVRWKGVEDAEASARVIGPRLRQLRESRQLTIRELADRAGISKNTLLRIEQGYPIAEAALNRVCDSLQTIWPNLLEAEPDLRDQKIKVYRDNPDAWRIAFCRKKAPSLYKDFDPVGEPRERLRLGRLGYASGFVQGHGSMLLAGRLQAAVVQVFGVQERAGFRHSGEEYVYCLEGRLRLTVADETHELGPGDSALFWSRHRHRYESPSNDEPATLLMVWYEAPEEEVSREHDDECDD